MKMIKNGIAAIALASLPLLGACSEAKDDATATASTKDDGTLTLAAAITGEEGMSKLRDALTKSELSGLLEGPGSYTVLAPTDTAFDALGEDGEALFADDQKPMLIALLRDHMVPGHLTPEAIDKAIVDKGGPVTMTTLGEGQVTFAKEGDAITVSMPGGAKAKFAGTAVAANNGVIIPLDAVLLPKKEG
ncbi:fasciclin domain-containing protein [Qipengyuania soli]|uniref:Fasciclin domain-containing protein n=1 Tax=Qipengyuania soli TaxID=2782568 RepID=A0A7S8IUS3_9SPHN|nr:fasciclin domain-containing protein [Qipengyuania soli]QPC99364.1 fasciclin domain-containing protein [Qipengyuania soli]